MSQTTIRATYYTIVVCGLLAHVHTAACIAADVTHDSAVKLSILALRFR